MLSPYVGRLPRHQEKEFLLQLLPVTIWSFVLSASFLDGHCPAAVLKLQSKPTYCTPSTWQVNDKGFSAAI